MASQLLINTKPNHLVAWLDSLVPVLICINIFFNPFPHTTSVKESCFYLSVGIIIYLWGVSKKRFVLSTPVMLPFLLFLGWITLTSPFAIDKANTLHDIYSHLIRYIIFYLIIINYFDTQKKLERLVWVSLISSAIFICWALFYYYYMLGHPLAARFATGNLGALGQAPIHIIGFVSLIALLFSLHLLFETKKSWIRLFLITNIVLMGSAILLTQSRGIMIALFFSMGIFMFRQNKKIVISLLVAFIATAILTPVGSRFDAKQICNNPRLKIAYTMLEISKDYPLKGIGYGMLSYSSLDTEKYDKRIKDPNKKFKPGNRLFIDDPHNWAIGLLVRSGIVGLTLYLYIIINVFRMGWETIKRQNDQRLKGWGICLLSCYTGFLVAGLFQPSFSHMLESILYSIIAMTTITWRLTNTNL